MAMLFNNMLCFILMVNTAVFTVLYVVFVPFVSYFFFSKNIHWSVWPSIFICLLGGLFLTELDNVVVRLGDSIALFNALFWSFHIVFISKLLRIFNYPITIAGLQCLIGSIFTFLPALIFEEVIFANILLEYKEILYVGILSSGFAFMLQIFSQQNLRRIAAIASCYYFLFGRRYSSISRLDYFRSIVFSMN